MFDYAFSANPFNPAAKPSYILLGVKTRKGLHPFGYWWRIKKSSLESHPWKTRIPFGFAIRHQYPFG